MEVNNDTTTIQLQCATNEATSYTWEKQDGAVPANAEGVDSNTLTLIGVTPDDNGQYRCVAINDNGRSYSNYATVTVEGNIHQHASTSTDPIPFVHTLPLVIVLI